MKNEEFAAAMLKAEPLPLDKVSIDGVNRLTHNRDLDIDQLISLPVKQQLYNYRDTYGLSTEDGECVNNARGYAAMVIRYVSDGSGTMDMIERAVRQLKEILNQ